MHQEKVAINTKALLEFLFLSRRNLTLILLSGFTCALIAAVVSLQMKNVYQAEAKIVVNKPAFKSDLSPEPLSVKTCEDLIYSPGIIEETRQQILRMRGHVLDLLGGQDLNPPELMEKARKIADMSVDDWKDIRGVDTETALQYDNLTPGDIIALYGMDEKKFRDSDIESLQKGVSTNVRIERKTNITVEYSPVLTIWAKMPSPHLAKLFVNTLAEVFVDLYSTVGSGQSMASVTLIEEKYEEVKENLETTENAITEFVKQYKLDLIDEKIKVLQSNIAAQTEELKKTEQQYSLKSEELEATRDFLNAMKENNSWMGYFFEQDQVKVSESTTSENMELSPSAEELRKSLRMIKNDYEQNDEAWVEFFRTYRIDTVTQQLESLRTLQGVYREKLFQAEINAESYEKATADLKAQIEKEGKTIAVQRGISEDALWQMITRKPTADEVANTAKITITEEELNPTYIQMANQFSQYKTELELNRAQAERLKTTLADLDKQISELEKIYAAGINRQDQLVLNKDVADDAFTKMSVFYVTLEDDEKQLSLGIDKLGRQVAELKQVLARNESDAENLMDLYQEKSTEHARLERRLEVYKETYKTLATDLDQARIAVIATPPDVRIAVPAVAPTKKVGPQRSIMVVVAGGVGIIAALVITYMFLTITILRRMRRDSEMV